MKPKTFARSALAISAIVLLPHVAAAQSLNLGDAELAEAAASAGPGPSASEGPGLGTSDMVHAIVGNDVGFGNSDLVDAVLSYNPNIGENAQACRMAHGSSDLDDEGHALPGTPLQICLLAE